MLAVGEVIARHYRHPSQVHHTMLAGVTREQTAIVGAADVLAAEMGEPASASAVAEAMITLEVRPYLRRILTAAILPG
jgi:hypothetical protein